jgi:hypothetical protein
VRAILQLDESLKRAAERTAAAEGMSLSAFVEVALRRYLFGHEPAAAPAIPDLPAFQGDGLLPGVDLERNADVRDRLERSD